MKKIILAWVCAIGLAGNLHAQNSDSTKVRPGQFSFFYPLGTSGVESPKYANHVSFNVLYGINGGVQGAEFGGLVNVNTGDVKGAQFAGIANVNTGTTTGVIFGGITNVTKDSANAAYFAGIANVTGKSAYGLQFAGISNTVNGNMLGGQFSGITNTTNGDLTGAQFGGIANVTTGDVTGVQSAGISNVTAGNVTGAQLGLINAAKKVKGTQIGLINVADEYEGGVPFGLFNFVRKGYHALEVSGGDAIYANLSLKMGVKKLYTTYRVGYAANNSEAYFTYGLGIGSLLDISDRFAVAVDASGNHILQPGFSPRLSLLSKADLTVRYNLNNWLSVFAGPSFNVFVSEYMLDSNNLPLKVPYTLYETDWANGLGSTSLWIGGNIGVAMTF